MSDTYNQAYTFGSSSNNPLPISDGGNGSSYLAGGLRPLPNNQGNPTSVTLSNQAASTSSITNPNIFKFNTGTTSAPVINITNFNFYASTPVITGYIFPATQSIAGNSTDNLNFGTLICEFVTNSTSVEVEFQSRGFITSVEIDGTLIAVFSGTNATAQAGGANTVTLTAGSSAVNNFYNTQYIYITGGTGIGQISQITGYVGSTKVATVSTNWATQPDATSTYVIGWSSKLSGAAPNTQGAFFPKFTFSGNRTSHLIRIYSGNPLIQVNVDSSGTVWRSNIASIPRIFLIGDSFGFTNSGDVSTGYPTLMSRHLGFIPFYCYSFGTGIVSNSSNTKLTYAQRTIPPINSWYINLAGASGGTFSLTQNGITTGSIASNANQATIQAALDLAFGTNQFYAVIPDNVNGVNYIVIGIGSNASVLFPLTLNSSLTGTVGTLVPQTIQYFGDITPNIPRDRSGNALPFLIWIQGSVNDVNATGLTAAAQSLYSGLASAFPTATIIAGGIMMSGGPLTGVNLTSEQSMETASLSLPLINGAVPFIKTFNSTTGIGYLNGTTNVSTASGVAGVQTDYLVANDGVHPTADGHFYIEDVLTPQISSILKVTNGI